VLYKTLNELTFRVFLDASLCSYHSFWERTFLTVAPLYQSTWRHIREALTLTCGTTNNRSLISEV